MIGLNYDWLNIQPFHEICAEIDSFDIISFDLFDTLLFRTCALPSDVFGKAGALIRERVNDAALFDFSQEDYMQLRKDAEQQAYKTFREKTGSPQCYFDDIINQLPLKTPVLEIARQAEIECEKEVLYLNPVMYNFLLYCHSKHKTIVFVSDMYHTKATIIDFLDSVGMDTALIDRIYVSCDYKCSKGSPKSLFDMVKQTYFQTKCERILHIGDNRRADVESAKKAGLSSVHYHVVPQPFGSIYDFEKQLCGVALGELLSLRKLAASASHGLSAEERALWTFGASVIGPLYAVFADCVDDIKACLDANGRNEQWIGHDGQRRWIESFVHTFRQIQNSGVQPEGRSATQRAQEVCLRGAASFQKLWLYLLQRKPALSSLSKRQDSFIGILLRLAKYPGRQEVEAVHRIMGSDFSNDEYKHSLLGNSRNVETIERYLENSSYKNHIWPQANVAWDNEWYFHYQLLTATPQSNAVKAFMPLIENILSNQYRKIAIYGAGVSGMRFLETASALQIPVTCFVDGNQSLWGKHVLGVPVCSLETAPKDVTAFVIPGNKYGNAMETVLNEYYSDSMEPPEILRIRNAEAEQ